MISEKRKKSESQTVLWWILWIVLTIASFFLAVAFWSPWIAERYGSVHETKVAVIWITAVFGTWMVMLLPLIVVMYKKVDKAYEDARIAREKRALCFKSIHVDKSKRLLPSDWSSKIATWPETIQGGHLVSLTLKDGRDFRHVFIRDHEEILGMYDQTEFPFDIHNISDIRSEDAKEVASSLTSNWLRFDGVAPSV